MSPRIELFSKMTQRIEPFFFEFDAKNWTLFRYDSKSWTLFFEYDSKNSTFFYHDSKELNLSFVKIWFKYLNLRLSMTQRSEPSFKNFTQRIELFFFVNMTQRSESFFAHDSKKWTFLNITQRIEPSFLIRRKELNLFLNLTQRIDPFSKYDSKNRTFFSKWLKELNFSFSKCDSKNWTSFWIWFKELNFCQIYTTQSQRIEPLFFNTTQRIEHLFFHVTHVFIWFKELIFFFEKILKELIFLMNQRMVPDAETWNLCFWNLIQRIGLFFFDDSQTWSFFFQKLWRKDFFLKKWLKELDLFVWLKESDPFFNVTFFFKKIKKLNSFQKNDSKNWTFFLVWLKELNLLWM